MKKEFMIGALSVIGAQLLWSTIEIVGTFVYREGVSPMTLLNVRYVLASLLMLVTIVILNKNLFKIKKRDIGILTIQGSVLLVHLLAFWQGIKILNHLPTALGVYFTFPLWIVLLSIFFWKEKLTKWKVWSLLLGGTGALVLVGIIPGFIVKANFIGTLLMLLAAICWAVYAMMGKTLFEKYHPFTVLFYNFLFIFGGTLLLQSPAITLSQINSTTLPNLVYMGVATTFLAFILFYTGINNIKPSTVGIISYVKPILSIILAYLILNQASNFSQIIGIGLILFSNYLIYKDNKNAIN